MFGQHGLRPGASSRLAALTAALALMTALVPASLLAQVSDTEMPSADTARPVVRVGFLLDGPDPEGGVLLLQRRSELLDGIRRELSALTARDFDVHFPEDKVATADWSVETIRRDIDALMADPEVDIVISVGPFATDELGARGPLPKPAVGVWAIDREAQQLPFVDNTTGVPNFNYVLTPGSLLRDLSKFRDIAPFDRVHILVDARLLAVIPEVPANVARLARLAGIEVAVVPADDEAAGVLSQLPADAEAVYVTPLLRMPRAEIDTVFQGLIDRRLPSFSLLGKIEVERGVLACLRTQADVDRVARRVALNVQRILLGENAGDLPVTMEIPERLLINMDTARRIGVFPRWRTRLEAELLNEQPAEAGRRLTLSQAVQEAVDRNLSLRALDRRVAAGHENISLALSALRPQVSSFGQAVRIDRDRAAASFGSQARDTGTAGLSLSQVLYSDSLRADLRVARQRQEALQWDRETARIDIALAASRTYLDVLRAQTMLRVADDNLRLTESNLDLARRRQRIGTAGPADTYRWESALATSRSDRIAAENMVRAARVALNRLLDRPLEEPFTTASPTLQDAWLQTCCERLDPYVNNPTAFEVFRDFEVQEALTNSPELQAIDAAIIAQERVRLAAGRSFWAPDVVLQGSAERDFWRDGTAAPPAVPIPFPDRNDWSLGVRATLPLFTGFARRAQVRQSTEELVRLRVERAVLVQEIDLQVRTVLFQAGSTYPAIELTREAADAAARNLELVTDSYSRGAVSIIDLLDAQNAALSADLFAATALFDFLLDLMDIQRATNAFDFFMSDAGRTAWYERLERFYLASGYPLPRQR